MLNTTATIIFLSVMIFGTIALFVIGCALGNVILLGASIAFLFVSGACFAIADNMAAKKSFK